MLVKGVTMGVNPHRAVIFLLHGDLGLAIQGPQVGGGAIFADFASCLASLWAKLMAMGISSGESSSQA